MSINVNIICAVNKTKQPNSRNHFYLPPCYDGLKCQSIVQNQGMIKMTIEQFIESISTIPYRSLEKEFDFARRNQALVNRMMMAILFSTKKLMIGWMAQKATGTGAIPILIK